ncbi:MAG: DUF1003 domain-containing protein [Saprospiraceae bacterium]|nr:DUF1003 domain-containing protein [Lewinellaceae bacterium]
MAKQTKYIKDLMSAESAHLEKLHQIVRHSLEEEELLTQTLMKADQGSARYGERLADKVAEFGGSWTFIITFAVVLVSWIALNSYFLAQRTFDPYPYILLNLILSCLAAIQAPVIMMSQNRQEAKDRKRAENDYLINLKSEIEIRHMHQKLDLSLEDQYKHLCEIQQRQIELLEKIERKLDRLGKQ